MNINTAFRNIFSTDMNLISDEIPPIQREINAENNARLIGSAMVTDRLLLPYDDIMIQCLTPRQLRG